MINTATTPRWRPRANQALRTNSEVPPGVEATSHLGNITLIGTVSTPAQSSAAEDIVIGVGGVVSIGNQIVILGAGPLASG